MIMMNSDTDIHTLPKAAFAGFFQRFMAFIIDVVPLILLLFAEAYLALKMSVSTGAYQSSLTAPLARLSAAANIYIPLHILTIFLFFSYVIYAHKNKGATFGKRLCRIRVVRLDKTPLNFSGATLRLLPLILLVGMALLTPLVFSTEPKGVAVSEGVTLSSRMGAMHTTTIKPVSTASEIGNALNAIMLIWLVGSAICIAASRRRQALHDILAKTVVIKV